MSPQQPHPYADPSAVIIRIPEVIAMTGLPRNTIYKKRRSDPSFPRAVKLSDSSARSAPVGFILAEVQAWVRRRADARGAPAAHDQMREASR